MLFSDITDCEMLVYRCIQQADQEIGLLGIMDELEKSIRRTGSGQRCVHLSRI